MRAWQRRCAYAALLIFLLASAAAPLAGGESKEENPAETPIGDLFRWLNLLVVIGGLGYSYLVVLHGPAWFDRRAESIARAIQEAAAAKAASDRLLREAEEKLGQLDREVAELGASAKRDFAGELERIRAATGSETDRIARAAKAEIEATARSARMELKKMAARLAVERAGTLLSRQVTPEVQGTLFRAFIEDLARSMN